MAFFSDDEPAQQAAGNQAAFFLATVTFLRREGIDPGTWTESLVAPSHRVGRRVRLA